MKIYGQVAHFKMRKGKQIFSGVDYARMVNPLKALAKKYPEYEVEISSEVQGKYKNWNEITKKFDIILSSYIDNDIEYVKLRVSANNNNCKYILDIDDDIWDVSKNHPNYKDYDPDSRSMFFKTQIAKDVEHIITTNLFLKYKIIENARRPHDSITVIHNYINLKDYDYKKLKPKKGNEIIIAYIGGSSHFEDVTQESFLEPLKRILIEYPNVYFKTTGFFMPQIKTYLGDFGYKYRHALGAYDVMTFINDIWPVSMGEADIVVAPLYWNAYSRAKSYIKYLEYSAAKKPGIYQNIDPYKEILNTAEDSGFLVNGGEDWYIYLKQLIESEELRTRIGNNAYKLIKKHTIEKGAEEYHKLFSKYKK